MTTELYFLTLICVFTACQWMPYILNQVAVRGLVRAMGNSLENDIPLSTWAERAKLAHKNSVENLAVFGLVVLVAHVADVHTELTATATIIYFFARLIHYFVFLAGVPFLRTALFLVSWLANMALVFSILTSS